MNISELSLKRPVLATVMNLMIILFGVVGYNFLAVRDYPAIDPPIINVSTSYTGANPDIIESQITEPLEKQSMAFRVSGQFLPRVLWATVISPLNLIWEPTWKVLPVMCVIKWAKLREIFHSILMRHLSL